MARITSRVLTVSILFSTSGIAWACYGEKDVVSSPQLERTVSHVVVGTLTAFREMEGTPGRYFADVVVSEVEKGRGIAVGETFRVRFTSPLSLDRLEVALPTVGHGGGQITPVPGERLRLYTQLNERLEYVADYPNCFFGLDRRAPLMDDFRGWNPIAAPGMSLDPVVVPMLAVAGMSLGLAVVMHNRRIRGASQPPPGAGHIVVEMPRSLPQFLEGHVEDRILAPIAMVEVPPFGLDDVEPVGLQDGFVGAAGHDGRFAGCPSLPGEIDGAAPVVFGSPVGIGHETVV